MGVKYPIEYEFEPRRIDKGSHWIKLKLKNLGDETIKNLDIQLNSMDSFTLSLEEAFKWLGDLKPGEEEVIPYRVNATRTTDIYASITGLQEGKYFYWESPTVTVDVGLEVAEIRDLYILSKPYTEVEEALEVEAVLEGKEDSTGLTLEFWLDTPRGIFNELGKIKIKELDADEEVRYTVEFTPREEGVYTAYAYLYHNDRLISRKSDSTIIGEE